MKNQILFEDEHIIAVEKLAGQLVVKDRFGNESLDNILIYIVGEHLRNSGHEPDEEGRDLFTLHRLDRDTIGIVVFAKNKETHKGFSKLFESTQLSKTYWYFACGVPDWEEAELELPLKRAEGKRGRGRALVNVRDGSRAKTKFELLESFGDISWIEAKPDTGKLHQIRVHSNILGAPLLNDKLYGDSNWQSEFGYSATMDRFPLHARFLEFIHPITEEHVSISCKLPNDMHGLLNELKKKKKSGLYRDSKK